MGPAQPIWGDSPPVSKTLGRGGGAGRTILEEVFS